MQRETCPSKEELSCYLLGSGSKETINVVNAHVDTCADCQSVLEDLDHVSDDLTSGLQQSVAEEPFSDEQACAAMMEQIHGKLLARIAEIGREAPTMVSEKFTTNAKGDWTLTGEADALGELREYRLLEELGHGVTEIARTHSRAVESALKTRPGLVLSDIQLADGSSGLDAVEEIRTTIDAPVIFITAYPEKWLTGERSEPTYMITKPFDKETVRAVISQALLLRTNCRGDLPIGACLENLAASQNCRASS